jgi:hypothetical protein
LSIYDFFAFKFALAKTLHKRLVGRQREFLFVGGMPLLGGKPEHATRLMLTLARLDAGRTYQNMGLPGLDLHPLKGNLKSF